MAIKKIKNKSNLFLSILIIIVLFLGFSILEPKVSAKLFAQKRKVIWQEFYNNLQSNKNLDSRKFWQFREFYSPGSFIFEPSGLVKKDLQFFLDQTGRPIDPLSHNLSFLKYSSPRILSVDSLTEEKTIDIFLKNYPYGKKHILSRGSNYLLLRQSINKVILIFLLPESEMKKTIGFFEYNERDKDLVRGKYWLSISLIDTD